MAILEITAEDILARWVGAGKPVRDDDPTFTILLEDAKDIIKNFSPNIDMLISAGAVSNAMVKQVITSMITRYYETAQQYATNYSESVGGFSHSASYGADKKSGVMHLTNDEKLIITGKEDLENAGIVNIAFKNEGRIDSWAEISQLGHVDQYGWKTVTIGKQ